MRRANSRPKYLISSSALGSNAAVVSSPAAAWRDIDDGAEAISRRRAVDTPKRLSPLEATASSSASNRIALAFKHPWPCLDIPAKDVEAMHSWLRTEEVLSQTLPDARCPYRFLDPRKHAPRHEDYQQRMARQWTFSDFCQEWDHPDDSRFQLWCEEMRARCEATVVSAADAAAAARPSSDSAPTDGESPVEASQPAAPPLPQRQQQRQQQQPRPPQLSLRPGPVQFEPLDAALHARPTINEVAS
mmetsp:Transcript_123180/g.355901  ORF Transcript_123180/g.355901 Transcript_123180/m.355901 type:complete len:245 (+) Transcript_123180:109-843(+)